MSINSTASQSSSSGCVGSIPCEPKSSLVSTMPVPNSCSQCRLATTRAVSGFLRSTSHLARPSRLRGRSSAKRRKHFRRVGADLFARTEKAAANEHVRLPLLVGRQLFHDRRLVRLVFFGEPPLDVLALRDELLQLRLQRAEILGDLLGLFRRALLGRNRGDLANRRRHGRGVGGMRIVGHQHAEMPERLAACDRQSASAGRRTILQFDWPPSATIGCSKPEHDRLRTLRLRIGRPAVLLRIVVLNRVAGGKILPLAVGDRPTRIAASTRRRRSTWSSGSASKCSVCCQTGVAIRHRAASRANSTRRYGCASSFHSTTRSTRVGSPRSTSHHGLSLNAVCEIDRPVANCGCVLPSIASWACPRRRCSIASPCRRGRRSRRRETLALPTS